MWYIGGPSYSDAHRTTAISWEFVTYDLLNTFNASVGNAHQMLTVNDQKYATEIRTNVNAPLLVYVNMDMYGIEFSANAFPVYHAPVHQDTILTMVSVDAVELNFPPDLLFLNSN